MKKLIIEDEKEGLIKLLGEYVTLYCTSFIYAGLLRGVNTDDVLLEDAEIVYDTGDHSSKSWATAEKLPGDWYVRLSRIESYGVFKHGK